MNSEKNEIEALNIILDLKNHLNEFKSKNSLIMKWFTNNKNKNIKIKKKNIPSNCHLVITNVYNKGIEVNGMSLIQYKDKSSKSFKLF